jgi:hypothetical protein
MLRSVSWTLAGGVTFSAAAIGLVKAGAVDDGRRTPEAAAASSTRAADDNPCAGDTARLSGAAVLFAIGRPLTSTLVGVASAAVPARAARLDAP